jgi:dihydrolipoamide dehydrogenase
MTDETYDVVVLGGGAGGIPAAIRAAQLGGKVAIVECRDFGGQCMNRGCIPFGHMMVASNIVKNFAFAKEMGISADKISTDFAALKKRQEELIAYMLQGVKSSLKKNKVAMIEGKGRLTGAGKLAVNEKKLHYNKIILATGAQWRRPQFPGAELEDVVTTDYLLEKDKLPRRALLWGRDPVLCLAAQFLIRFGSQVILATPEKKILSNEMKTLTTRLSKALKEEGIDIKTRTEIKSASKKSGGLNVTLSTKGDTEIVVVDKIITLERAADLKDIGAATVGLDEGGDYLAVNEKMETTAKGVYALGDLMGSPSQHYSHRASETGIIAAENAMGHNRTINPKTATRILFTQPQVASVGLTAREAKAAGYDVMIGSASLSMNPFGMILSENEGLVEVVADKDLGELLGLHIIGTAAAEMASQGVLALQMEGLLEDLARASCPHPTFSESVAEAARDALGRAIYVP